MAHPTAAPALAGWAARPVIPEPTYQTLLTWALALLRPGGAPRPLCKRLAVLIGGLLADEQATLSSIAAGIRRLAASPAREPSILRRLERLLDDPRLAPGPLLGAALPGLLPLALGAVLRAEPAAPPRSAGPVVRLVVDETTLLKRLHVLVIGLGVPGLVLPVAVRCWRQNEPLGEGQYWVELSDACWQVQRLLPPEVRRRVLLLADRAFGVPHLLDLAHQLGWDLVVRVQGQAKVRLDAEHASTRPLALRQQLDAAVAHLERWRARPMPLPPEALARAR